MHTQKMERERILELVKKCLDDLEKNKLEKDEREECYIKKYINRIAYDKAFENPLNWIGMVECMATLNESLKQINESFEGK